MRPHILAGFHQASAAGPLCEDRPELIASWFYTSSIFHWAVLLCCFSSLSPTTSPNIPQHHLQDTWRIIVHHRQNTQSWCRRSRCAAWLLWCIVPQAPSEKKRLKGCIGTGIPLSYCRKKCMGSLLLPGLMVSLMYTYLKPICCFIWVTSYLLGRDKWSKQRRRQDGSAPTANPYGPMSGQVMVATKECCARSIGVDPLCWRE